MVVETPIGTELAILECEGVEWRVFKGEGGYRGGSEILGVEVKVDSFLGLLTEMELVTRRMRVGIGLDDWLNLQRLQEMARAEGIICRIG